MGYLRNGLAALGAVGLAAVLSTALAAQREPYSFLSYPTISQLDRDTVLEKQAIYRTVHVAAHAVMEAARVEAVSQSDLDTDLAKQVFHDNRYRPERAAVARTAEEAVSQADLVTIEEKQAIYAARWRAARATPGSTEQRVFQLLQLQGGPTWGGPFVPAPTP